MIVVHLLKTQIIFSLIAIVVSFSFYISPYSAVMLSCEQMNEILLAVFGAGVSVLFVGVMEYWHRMHQLENDLLNSAEPLISAVAGLAECTVESIGDVRDPAALLIDYFKEERVNAPRRKGAGILPVRHDKRNCIIREIERCSDEKCESYASDSSSSSFRYIQRAEYNIAKSISSYRSCARTLNDTSRINDDLLARFSYLTGSFMSIPLLGDLPGAKKTLFLREFIDAKTKVVDALKPAFGQVRLFDLSDAGYDELLSAFKEAEKQWLRYSFENGSSFKRNTFAYSLFEPLSKFAAMTKSSVAEHYKTPWWEP